MTYCVQEDLAYYYKYIGRILDNAKCFFMNGTAAWSVEHLLIQGVFCDCRRPKKLKYGKPRLGESTST